MASAMSSGKPGIWAQPPPLPDHLSVDPRSPHYDAKVLEREIGVRFNDHERHDVEEYCLSEGWIKVPAGKALDRRGQPLTFTLRGKVEAWIKTPGDEPA